MYLNLGKAVTDPDYNKVRARCLDAVLFQSIAPTRFGRPLPRA
jgi:hypothetical protein